MKYKAILLIILIFQLGYGQKEERPNIVLILCDDLGYSDVGFNGAKDIKTPTLDKLAQNGIVFSSAYVAHPFCGPSRAALMTGKYPHTIGSQFNLPPNSEETIHEGIPVEEVFISQVLKDAGYTTGIMGKWHLGADPQFHPNKRGFDDFYGFLGGGHRYFPEQFQPEYERQVQAGNEIIFDYLKPLEHNGKNVKETEYITDALSREASRFVQEASSKEEPFFLYLAYNAPHSPLEAKEEDLALYQNIKDKKRRTYAAMVHAVDRGVSSLVETLKKTGELDNTLIIFLSDNGGKLTLGATNYPLREGKGSTCEGGYRVPMFFYWPKKINGGETYDFPVTAIDFYPTFANLGLAKIPKTMIPQGKDIWQDVLSGNNAYQGQMIYALRHRKGYSDVGARQDQWKILKTNQEDWKLYNIENDKGEMNDLSDQYPDVLSELVTKAKKWSDTNVEPKWFHAEYEGDDWREMKMPHFEETFSLK